MKGDVFPTRKHMGWHSVALLQEMEAEGNCNSSYENVRQVHILFRDPLKTSENQRFSNVLTGYNNGTLA